MVLNVTSARLRRLPLRLVTGAFILDAGLKKRTGESERAAQLQAFAAGTYPFVKRLSPDSFLKLLAGAEIGLGALLLLPVIPARFAGLALAGFSGGLLGLYLGTPGMHEPGSLRATAQGIPLSKDVWMAGIAAALVIDDLTSSRKGR
jgi:hypothetical protein